MKRVVKKYYKIVIGLVIGILISATVVYAAQTVLSGNEVSYNNETSGGSSNTVQGAIDDLYQKINSYKEYIPNDNPNRNIVKAYKYDEDSNSNTYCVTGDEGSCFITSCYDNKAKDSCPPGTIVEYKVNDSDTIRFHVVHDDGVILILQTQKNTVYDISWGNAKDSGPTTVLETLEKVTDKWINVNEVDYSIGYNKVDLGYSGCYQHNNCVTTIYTLEKKKVKARMLTVQEANKLGCTNYNCPIWMYNYLFNSTSFNGTQNDTYKENGRESFGYWLMNASADVNYSDAWYVSSNHYITTHNIKDTFGARAVVEINKSAL